MSQKLHLFALDELQNLKETVWKEKEIRENKREEVRDWQRRWGGEEKKQEGKRRTQSRRESKKGVKEENQESSFSKCPVFVWITRPLREGGSRGVDDVIRMDDYTCQ